MRPDQRPGVEDEPIDDKQLMLFFGIVAAFIIAYYILPKTVYYVGTAFFITLGLIKYYFDNR